MKTELKDTIGHINIRTNVHTVWRVGEHVTLKSGPYSDQLKFPGEWTLVEKVGPRLFRGTLPDLDKSKILHVTELVKKEEETII